MIGLNNKERKNKLEKNYKDAKKSLEFHKRLLENIDKKNHEHDYNHVISIVAVAMGRGKNYQLRQCLQCGQLAEFTYSGKFTRKLTQKKAGGD